MRKQIVCLLFIVLTGCNSLQLVSPYDAVIDEGLREYKESINLLAKDLSDQAGTLPGTYAANQSRYNALEVKIDLLIDRATLQSTGNGCKLNAKLAEKVAEVMGDAAPPASDNPRGDSYGCTEHLLQLVRDQLELLQTIHRDADRCTEREPPANAAARQFSCLRPATSSTAMKITNQSINAAWVVETAKKARGEE